MSNNNETKKVIRLDHSRTDRAFKQEESLWDDEIERMGKLIDNHIHALEEYEKQEGRKKLKEMPRLSIGIYGSPGSGKSSLVETFVEMVNKSSTDLPLGLSGKIHSLPVIKPNILAKDEHFLYKFLATALNEEKEKKRGEGPQYRESSILTELEQTFQEVSQYLQVIDQAERRQDDDPLGVSLDRLDRHESGVKLVEKMGEFINMLANSLVGGKPSSVIFMPVDDADLSMDTLISAIGTCWRYLQHPRLIPIFTFTGRLAEELLRVHFEEKLTIKGNDKADDKLKEASTSLLITENMAMQYLGKLIPVRNRIRLGPASARVLGANYISSEYERTKKIKAEHENDNEKTETVTEFEVLELLETVSRLLFGHARVPIVPAIRPPLRMVTLRRQIQIVDAMQAAGIESFMIGVNRQGKNKKNNPEKSWGQLFDLATWTLLNTHRDVLKEINMNLDDLYSWTPKGLRQVVLDSILEMNHEKRSRLLKHWRYRTEDRRSQILSLLAANVFRPRMFGEEPTGDEPGAIGEWEKYLTLRKQKDTPNSEYNKKMDENRDSLPLSKGLLWFINLCIGFYVPQILACNRIKKETNTDPGTSNVGSISGVGWDFSSGPIHAIREAIRNNKIFSTGMLFLDPMKFCKQIWEVKKKDEAVSVLNICIWCFYGFREGRPWAAVSLWRGLGLIAQLLKIVEDTEDETERLEEIKTTKDEKERKERIKTIKEEMRLEKIKTILKKHLDSALVLGNLPKGGSPREKNSKPNKKKKEITTRPDVIFPKWTAFDEEGDSEDGRTEKGGTEKGERLLEKAIEQMAEKLKEWLKKVDSSNRILPMLEGVEKADRWRKCFTRRLHGENIMSIFWQDLENKYYQKELDEWNLHLILKDWFSVLEDYWSVVDKQKENNVEPEGIEKLLNECPILNGKEDGEQSGKTGPMEKYKSYLKKIKIETIQDYSIFQNNDIKPGDQEK
jgi:hypothetical protein